MTRSIRRFLARFVPAPAETFYRRLEEIQRPIVAERAVSERNSKTSEEILWGRIFNDTIANSEWLTDRSFSPGRWAVGYPYLYVLYRILNEIKPRCILDVGLGLTSRMIAQYVVFNNDSEHYVVEHDTNWIEFFANTFSLPERSTLISLKLIERAYLDDDKVTAYESFGNTFSGKRFDLISVDGPYGYSAKKYARVDILDLLPGILLDSFVILVDDYGRKGEQATVELVKGKLTENNISFAFGTYAGKKDMCVICSQDRRFLCSM